MPQLDLQQFARQLHSPAYLFDTDAFARRAHQVKEAFGDEVELCFSIKANPFLLKDLPQDFSRIEVCSPGELSICERLGVDMRTIVFSGVNKTAPDVDRAVADGVGLFTAESPLHLALLEDSARKQSVSLPVILRIAHNSQFGMDEQNVLEILGQPEQYPHLDFVGLHYFTGTQKKKAAAIIKELDYLSGLISRIREELGLEIRHLEYGTGLAVSYFEAEPEAAELQRLAEIAPHIRQLGQQVPLCVEMGRFFAAPCGYYFTTVIDTKTNGGIHYAICDGGTHQVKYHGQILGMQLPPITQISLNEHSGEIAPWMLCGSLCTTADVLAKDVPLDDLQPGDVLVFGYTGAYSVMEGISLFLSRDIPQVALYSQKDGLRIVREGTPIDLFNTPDGKALLL